MPEPKSSIKPRLRGYVHQEAFFFTLGACTLLIAKSSNSLTLLASLIYSASILLLFGVSASYHRPYWGSKGRTFMKRLDHCAIFVLIAGTFTPICLLALPPPIGQKLLLIAWIAAAAGIFQSIFWSTAPKWLTALFYVGIGWMALPYLAEMKASIGLNNIWMLVAGGIFYTVGAVFYVIKKPNLFPGVFGYHELFHIFTIFGAGCHFAVIYQLIR